MKLHVFDSCPYCVRVKVLIGLKGLDCQINPMVLGQLPDSVEGKLEKFSVPILEESDPENGESTIMTESLDIFRKLDSIGTPLFFSYEPLEKVVELLGKLQQAKAPLSYPRMPLMNLPELSSEEALKMFRTSREEAFGQTLEQAIDNTAQYIPGVEKVVEELEQALMPQAFINGDRNLNIDDVVAFAELRNLTMVGEFNFSEQMQAYLDVISSRSNVPLYVPATF
ncbi:glutathione S-transferase N-terminal domain-containing protein [Vibrio mediterranei]|uniref:glutathione S-transferase N-terminal domain-containing protein n=1 Tax=Vibrio mediterranei TaxID=689 RepID=UPI00148CF354|nr:glutathione S-transferase N-terminal domain-containing protein [Vibrio mediterranei]NOH26891.1 glutaredoxin [Vibrio mediterranei]